MPRREFTPMVYAEIVRRARDENGGPLGDGDDELPPTIGQLAIPIVEQITRRGARKCTRSITTKCLRWIEELLARPATEECIPWPFSKRKSGYGQIFVKGRRTTSHRIICELTRGDAPFDGAHAAHECGKRDCCNPKHIVWKTPKANAKDKNKHGTQLRGSQVYNAKLTEDDVQEIRRRLRNGASLGDMSEDFGVCRQTLSDIGLRKCWRHI